MVIGLLTLAGIPTTIGVAEGISRRDEAKKDAQDQEAEQMRKFQLECYCESHSVGKARLIHRGRIMLKGGKMWIEPTGGESGGNPFEGFYVQYADQDRPNPPMGMVSMVFDDDKPTLNWIYVDRDTREVKYGNRSKSKDHVVGPWSWDAGEQGGAGGVTLDVEEGAVAVETLKGWQVCWEDADGKIGVHSKGKIQISLERKMLEPTEKEEPKASTTEPQHGTTKNTNTNPEPTKTRFEDKAETRGGGQSSMVKVTAGNTKNKKKKQPKLEIAPNTFTKPLKNG